jgi:hypothetical protein
MSDAGTFDYVAVVPEAGPLAGFQAALRAPTTLVDDELWDDRLVGYEPRIEITAHELALLATRAEHASVAGASLAVDPGLLELLRPGDQLSMLRTNSADLAVSVVRERRLVLAFGAVSFVPLGGGIRVSGSLAGAAFSVAGEVWALEVGDAATIGGYEVRVWHGVSGRFAFPGHGECVSMGLALSGAGQVAHNCVELSAGWAQARDPLRITRFTPDDKA